MGIIIHHTQEKNIQKVQNQCSEDEDTFHVAQ